MLKPCCKQTLFFLFALPLIAFFIVFLSENSFAANPDIYETNDSMVSANHPPDEYENDDVSSKARAILLNVPELAPPIDLSQRHDFHDRADKDWILFYARAGTFYGISVSSVGENCDPVIGIFSTDGSTALMPETDQWSYGEDEYVEWKCEEDGVYYALVRQYNPEIYGEGTDYTLDFYCPYLSFPGFVYGVITPSCITDASGREVHAAVSTAGQENTSVLALCNGYYFMPYLAGDFTLKATLAGYQDYLNPIRIGELEGNEIDIDLTLLQNHALSFEASAKRGYAPFSVEFNPIVPETVSDYSWDFGDGTTSSEGRPTHTYLQPGSYNVSLAVVGESGASYQAVEQEFIQVDPVLCFLPVKCAGGWQTEIGVVNKDAEQAATGDMTAFDSLGNQVSPPTQIDIPPLGSSKMNVGRAFEGPEEIQYIVLRYDSGDLAGYTRCFRNGQVRAALPAADNINEEQMYLAHVASSDIWETEVTLVNLHSDDRNVLFEFSNLETVSILVGSGESSRFTIRDLFEGVARPDIESARIKNCDGLVGAELFTSGLKLSGVLLEDVSTDRMFFPHIASDDFWYTGLAAYNPSDFACQISITPHAADGRSFDQKIIAVGGNKKYIGTVGNLNLPGETAWIEILSSTPITGFELFGARNDNQMAGYAGVDIYRKKGVFPMLEKSGATGIAFVNIGDATQNVVLKAISGDGVVLAQTSVSLNPFQKSVGVAKSFFANFPENADHLAFEAPQEIVGFQLNASSDFMMLDAIEGM